MTFHQETLFAMLENTSINNPHLAILGLLEEVTLSGNILFQKCYSLQCFSPKLLSQIRRM